MNSSSHHNNIHLKMSRAPAVKNAPHRHESSSTLRVSDLILFKIASNYEPRLGFITYIYAPGTTDAFHDTLLIKVDDPMVDFYFNKKVLVKKVGNIQVANSDGTAGDITHHFDDVWNDFRPLSECNLVCGEADSWYWVTTHSSMNNSVTKQIDQFISGYVQNLRGSIICDEISIIEILSSYSFSDDDLSIEILNDGMYETVYCFYS